MTFAVALENCEVEPQQYIPKAISALVSYVLESRGIWENQPLDVVVTDRCRSQVLDPRESTAGQFVVAVVSEGSAARACRICLEQARTFSSEELLDYVKLQLSSAEPVTGAVSAVFNVQSTHPEKLSAAYVEFAGAWLRVAPDATTGGLIASADHLVLDGAMFQELLLKMARCSATVNSGNSQLESSAEELDEPVARLRVDGVESLTAVIKNVVDTLQDFGIDLLNGRDTALLVTIPHVGPEVNQDLERQRHRVLPLIMDLESAHSTDEIKRRINELNRNGWCSLGAQVWQRLYCGNVYKGLVYYMEQIAPRIPFQRVSRYVAGAALISCLPPFRDPELAPSQVTHLSCRTMNPVFGGPTVTIMQVCGKSSGTLPSAFITISGSGQWSRITRLNKFRDSLAQRIYATQRSTPIKQDASVTQTPARSAR